jgi:hypothetical protein
VNGSQRYFDPTRTPGAPAGDDQDEMRTHRMLDERTVEAVLAGRSLPEGREELHDLAAFCADVRATFDGAPAPAPSDELAAFIAAGTAAEPTPLTRRTSRMRAQTLRRVVVTKLATAGLLAKAGMAVAATATVVGGVGAAGALPTPAQDAFDRAVGNEARADLPEEAGFGQDVSTDARDGGVDGGEISDEARARAEERRDDDGGNGEVDATEAGSERGLENARERTADTPARVPDETPVGRPAEGENRAPETTPNGQEIPAGPPAAGDEGDLDAAGTPPEGTPGGQPEGTPAGPPDGVNEGEQPDEAPPSGTPGGPPSGTPNYQSHP